MGEELVAGVEQTVKIFKILMTECPAGAWQYIKDQVGDIVSTVLGGIRDFVIQKIVIAGIGFLLSLLSPASAFVRAVKMLIDVVMFFINRGQQIIALVQAITGSLAAIASGNIGAMASAIEKALAKAIPVALAFLSGLLGVGGIAEKIKEIISKIKKPIDKAIDWLKLWLEHPVLTACYDAAARGIAVSASRHESRHDAGIPACAQRDEGARAQAWGSLARAGEAEHARPHVDDMLGGNSIVADSR